MTSFNIEATDSEVRAALADLARRAANPAPAFKVIGEDLLAQTRRTFQTSTDPWGNRWRPNAPSTLLAMAARRPGALGKKSGKLTQKGAGLVMGKRPLIGESQRLSGSSLFYSADASGLTLASSATHRRHRLRLGSPVSVRLAGMGSRHGHDLRL
jgi:hypothetical protein